MFHKATDIKFLEGTVMEVVFQDGKVSISSWAATIFVSSTSVSSSMATNVSQSSINRPIEMLVAALNVAGDTGCGQVRERP